MRQRFVVLFTLLMIAYNAGRGHAADLTPEMIRNGLRSERPETRNYYLRKLRDWRMSAQRANGSFGDLNPYIDKIFDELSIIANRKVESCPICRQNRLLSLQFIGMSNRLKLYEGIFIKATESSDTTIAYTGTLFLGRIGSKRSLRRVRSMKEHSDDPDIRDLAAAILRYYQQ